MGGIEDLLFGIPANSPRNFLHEYNSMRIGAILEKGSDTLKVRRRKGNKDTLLGDDDLPIPSGEGALIPFLGGADRRFYSTGSLAGQPLNLVVEAAAAVERAHENAAKSRRDLRATRPRRPSGTSPRRLLLPSATSTRRVLRSIAR